LALGCAASGAVGTLAIACYTFATREQLVSVAAVLSALYPVVPVLLGLTVLREQLTRGQAAGLGLAGAAVGQISLAGRAPVACLGMSTAVPAVPGSSGV